MAENHVSIQLYDSDITCLLNGWPEDILLPRVAPDHMGVFADLQAQSLIHAIYQRSYSRAYSLLRKLDHVLSPVDAMAACLCALACTPKLMNTLLDHCPPIPEFQFQGVGTVSSLLHVAVRHDNEQMLDILLQRGADPHAPPTHLSDKSLVEEAFCGNAYFCLKRLLEIPDLELCLTEEMLYAWGSLTDKPSDWGPPLQSPAQLWCCQHLYERLTGEPAGLFDPLPIPPQLRMKHALRHANFELAEHICVTRPLTEEDKADVLKNYAPDRLELHLFQENDIHLLYAKRQEEIQFLCQLLHRCPDLLHPPQLRSAVALAVLAPPKPEWSLQYWVQQMEDGPVLIPSLPRHFGVFQSPLQSFPWWGGAPNLAEDFFVRWEERLGSRLYPAMDINTPDFEGLSPESIRQALERIHFIGQPSLDALSAVAMQTLLYAPEDLLPQLLPPGELLGRENPSRLLDGCHALPPARRNLLLPLIQKSPDYSL